jgi:hypothetical protein
MKRPPPESAPEFYPQRLDLFFTLMRMKQAAERSPSDLAAQLERMQAETRPFGPTALCERAVLRGYRFDCSNILEMPATLCLKIGIW